MGTNDSVLKFRLSKEHLEMLDRYCKVLGENRSEVIRTLISYAYEKELFISEESQVNEVELDYYKNMPLAKYKRYKKLRQKKSEYFAKAYDEYNGDFSHEELRKLQLEISSMEEECDGNIHLFYDIFEDNEESN